MVEHGQLLMIGLSRSAIKRWVAAGRLWPRHRGVYAVGHPNVSRLGRHLAAVLACGDGAVLSHRSAAALWELRKQEHGPADVTIPRTGARVRPGVRIHVSGTLSRQTTTRVNGIPVTTPERMLTDCADVLTPSALQHLLASAERKHLVDRRTLAIPPGRRRVVREAHLFTRSENERALYLLLRVRGLPLPLANLDVDGWECDFIWPAFGLVVEVDSWFTHGDPAAFERDRLKDERLDERGLRVRRVTDKRLHERPVEVARAIERALTSCGWVRPPDPTA